MRQIRVGTSGWTFAGWRGGFYPQSLAQKNELAYASRRMNSIEINGTFYSLQKPESFLRWREETPEDFVFSVKAPQYITHVRRLKDVEDPLANFLASGVLALGRKLGPILWQFPPNVMLKDDRFETFFRLLPHDSESAARLAKKHTSKVEGRSFVDPAESFRVRHAFEFRHPSFADPAFIALMRERGVAVVFAHSGLKSPYMEDLTADFVYLRMHGQEPAYRKGYPDKALDWLEKRTRAWVRGEQPEDAVCASPQKPRSIARDAFVYFDTEAKDYAPSDAERFARKLGLPMNEAELAKAAEMAAQAGGRKKAAVAATRASLKSARRPSARKARTGSKATRKNKVR